MHSSPIETFQSGRQTTLASPVRFSGTSPYRNKPVQMICRPARAHTGICFRYNGQLISASPHTVVPSVFHTTELSDGTTRVQTVEHLLSAFYGMGIDNAEIELTGDLQVPLLDGSALPYARAFARAGRKYLSASRTELRVVRPFLLEDSAEGRLAVFAPAPRMQMTVLIHFDNYLGTQLLHLPRLDSKFYLREISPARTFFVQPYSATRYRSLRRRFRILPADPRDANILSYTEDRYLTPPRFSDEPVRHKLVDFLGDLSLTGFRIRSHILLYKPGHAFTRRIVQKLDTYLK